MLKVEMLVSIKDSLFNIFIIMLITGDELSRILKIYNVVPTGVLHMGICDDKEICIYTQIGITISDIHIMDHNITDIAYQRYINIPNINIWNIDTYENILSIEHRGKESFKCIDVIYTKTDHTRNDIHQCLKSYGFERVFTEMTDSIYIRIKQSIGIAIPCYKYHISKLKSLLDSIETQTRRPQQVIISCSSSIKEDIPYMSSQYSFPFIIIPYRERKNAAENRNIAMDLLDTDIISFFDADDVMHPQRIEYIMKAFFDHTTCNIVLHSYVYYNETQNGKVSLFNKHMVIKDKLHRAPSGCAVLEHPYNEFRIHHSQVSVSGHICKHYRFKEGIEYERREDSVFCGDILTNVRDSVYIKNPLSIYYEEGATYKVGVSPDNPSTAVVMVCDEKYFSKAMQTISDVRTAGKWCGDIVLMVSDFMPDTEFINKYDVIIRQIHHIDTILLVNEWKSHPIRPMDDHRHTIKLTQWDKLHVFDDWFSKWDRVIYLDSGLCVLDNIDSLLCIPWRGKICGPDDSHPGDNGRRFGCQLDLDANSRVNDILFSDFSKDILQLKYFLNCMWIYDTSLLKICNCIHLEDGMNKYPISLTNEMGIMNLYFTCKHNVWSPFPEKVGNKYLFGWSELNYSELTWRDFYFLKYPVTL